MGRGRRAPSLRPPDAADGDEYGCAISVDEGASVQEACRLMWALRIHRIPVVKDGKVTGIVSSMDVVHAIAQDRLS